jgi:midasin
VISALQRVPADLLADLAATLAPALASDAEDSVPTATAAAAVAARAADLGARIAAVASEVASVRAALEAPGGRSTAGRFEWVDGSLTRAVERGGWVLLDNANLCNPTVLDRLNPLLEPGGVLQLSEAGGGAGADASGRVITPHPDFRLILCLDPRHGEVSRAMRNRGIELFLLPPPAGHGGGAQVRSGGGAWGGGA